MQRNPLRLAVLAASALLACSPAPSSVPPSARQGRFTVASFNVQHSAWDDPETVDTIGETQADVIFLQEVSPQWERVLAERYRALYPHQSFAAARGAGGLGVLSRFLLRDEGLLPPVLKHPAWLTAVMTPAGEIHVLNVHLRASRRPGQGYLAGWFSMSADHELEIREFLRACPVEPTLVLGDFNEGPDGSAVNWLKDRGFVDALEQHRPDQPTWRALPSVGVFRLVLDHILYRSSLPALDAWVLRRGNSDHWPVLARF